MNQTDETFEMEKSPEVEKLQANVRVDVAEGIRVAAVRQKRTIGAIINDMWDAQEGPEA